MDARIAENLHEPRFFLVVAQTPSSLRDASALVAEVYGQRLALRASVDTGPVPADTRVLLVRDEHGLALATLTLQSAGFAPGCRAALELERSYRLESTGVEREHVAEMRRVAARAGASAARRVLFRGAVALCQALRVHYLLGLVESGDRVDAAAALWRGFEREQLIDESRTLAARWDTRPLLTAIEALDPAQAAPLPERVRTFVHAFGARVCGLPSAHPHFPNRLVTPMWASLPVLAGVPNRSKREG